MPRDGIVTLYNVDDAKIFKLTADTSVSLTYANPIDCPGIQEVSFKHTFQTAELKGDATILDKYSKVQGIAGTIKMAKAAFQLFVTLLGGTWAASGTTPNEKGTFTLKGAHLPNYFKVEAQVKYLGGEDAGGSGDFHFTAYKCKITDLETGYLSEDYATVTVPFESIPTVNDDKIYILEENESTIAISSTADSTAPTVSSTTPADAATGVAASGTITVNFSEDMDKASIGDAANYTLTRANGDGVTLGTITVVTAQQVTVAYSSLVSLQVYIFTVTTGVRDASYNRLAAPYSINFTIA